MTRAQRAREFRKDVNPLLLLVVFLSLFLASCATIEHMRYTYDPLNFHAVRDGVMYRSAQPTGHDLRMVVEECGIRSIINLRGAQPGNIGTMRCLRCRKNWGSNRSI